MSMNLKSAALAAVLLGAGGIVAGSASAMPVGGGIDPAVAVGTDLQPQIEQARWVCGPFGRCHWAPNYWRPAPRFYHRPMRRWRRW